MPRKRKHHDFDRSFYNGNVKDSELLLQGELLGIDILFSSFRVRWQYHDDEEPIFSLVEQETYYPIRCLRQFFLVNSQVEQIHYTARPEFYRVTDAQPS